MSHECSGIGCLCFATRTTAPALAALIVTTWLVVMTREFPDELLSAFLDNELSPAERAQVEQHLAASTADSQLLAELKTLRNEVGSLPPVTVSPGFADRVVR